MEELLKKLSGRSGDLISGQPLFQVLAPLTPRLKMTFVVALFVFLFTSFVLLMRWNDQFLVMVPRHGGSLSEGIIGRPRFINPVIARSDADRDIVALIYSGLLKATPEGKLIPDLAASYDVSPDGRTYTFVLRDDLVWHDGLPITSADVAFTIEKVRDQGIAIKSPWRASWEGVGVTTPDPKTVIFQIKQPYTPFLGSATIGILPKHVWQNVPNEEFDVAYYNIEPIGSGPYRIDRIVLDKVKGLPQYYDLMAFKRYALGEPYITRLRIAFFGNNKELEEAYADLTVEQMSSVPPKLAQELTKQGAPIKRAPLPRIFAAFFNQNQQPIFTDKFVREALALSVNKDRIVKDVLLGYGKPIVGPLPFIIDTEGKTIDSLDSAERTANARALLEKGGWTLNTAGIYEKIDKKKKHVTPLEFSMATPDVPELKAAAEYIRND
ncbi:MAG: ABC transporter substrate-binding protein, partial [Patescibacteria group bacterium]